MSRGRNGTKKPTAKGQNLVTILFVFGVIGWGFFAIDRLTETEGKVKSNRIQGRALGHEAGWKKSVRDWLGQKLGSAGQEKSPADAESVSRNIPQNEVPLLAEPEGLETAEHEAEIPLEAVPEAPKPTHFLFYRLNQKGQPVLSQVKRQAVGGGDLRTLVTQLVRGPSGAELQRDYIDSFIRKPRILNAGIEGKCAFVDFDTNFGAGVSYQTLRFQIQQIFRNVESWKVASCLEIRVRGKYSSHLGSDGLFFPRRIDAAWLSQNL